MELKAALKFVFISSVVDYTQQIGSKKQVYLVLIPYPCLKPYLKVRYGGCLISVARNSSPNLSAESREPSWWLPSVKSNPSGSSNTDHNKDPDPGPSTPSMMASSRISAHQEPWLDAESVSEWMAPDTTKCTLQYQWKRFLDQNDQKDIESRLEAITGVYKALTTREIALEFRADNVFYQLKQKKKTTAWVS